MLPGSKVKCPATGFARSCREIVAECECPKFVHVQFREPHSGNPVDKYGCADAFMPVLTVLAAQATHQAGAAIESFRNEVLALDKAATEERRETIERLVEGGTIRMVAAR